MLDRPDELGGSATVRLRVPHGTKVDGLLVELGADGSRLTVPDGAQDDFSRPTLA